MDPYFEGYKIISCGSKIYKIQTVNRKGLQKHIFMVIFLPESSAYAIALKV